MRSEEKTPDMELRTIVRTDPSSFRITYADQVMLVGSCFASSIGMKMKAGKMPVLINPSGTVYNPVSIMNTLDIVLSGKKYSIADLSTYEGKWFSFGHYTDFTSYDPAEVLEMINWRTEEAGSFLAGTRCLFITFGTARVYTENKSGTTVSNCHKIPDTHFSSRMLQPGEIVEMWMAFLDRLHERYPAIKVIFTISPVRHWKDGAHGNQVSKAALFIAVEHLLSHKTAPVYFPAYEILMDDLRDYRFYDTDMLHPSSTAVDYIWEAFSSCFFDDTTRGAWNEIVKISKALDHRFTGSSIAAKARFAGQMLNRISLAEKRYPMVDFEAEKLYFRSLSG